MFDEIKIVRNKDFVAVYDGNTIINQGSRPVDRNFAGRVYRKMVKTGYSPIECHGETTFHDIAK
jgi:hypothetical protein